ncbi:hypothetical protein A1395_22315 [Pseudomonas protegens]|uniref:hypothetical protein n=1 Tax=Pseudomonas protegens TaxID=380021 RepID=UPI000C9BD378|nr:hypothetical protein [Pseudomonas protegens]PNG32241.1 hypothetical protein A1395_22315 [Pseudomonas protegens]
MSTFVERNPKERAVEKAFEELAKNDYVSIKPDPADNIFEIAEKLRRRAMKEKEADKLSSLPNNI